MKNAAAASGSRSRSGSASNASSADTPSRKAAARILARLVLGLYDKKGRLIHVGQAGSGFDQKSLGEISKLLEKIETKKNPFFGEVEALRKVSWVKPELVAEIEYAEWTGGTNEGSGPKLRAPVFLGLRDDKDPKECLLEDARA